MAKRQRKSSKPELFIEQSGQLRIMDKTPEQLANESAPVECFGMTFENDAARRVYFLGKLQEKLKDPEFRETAGFPVGSDDDILRLSDPPYYTACPNPFISEFIQHYGRPYDTSEDYAREPFATDVSEGKNDPLYNAHSYHTKVPHKAIARYILHYTEPGDLVFDGFCGTGMTGVAAQMCGSHSAVDSLGYTVLADGVITDSSGQPISKLGARRSVLNDLSPAATFISYNYNAPVDVNVFGKEARRILKELSDECGWMYETTHTDGRSKGRINYTVWSEVFSCPECSSEIVFMREAFDQRAQQVRDSFLCPHCGANVTKARMELLYESHFDAAIGKTIRVPKRVPVLINYNVGQTRYEKEPDESDLDILNRIEQMPSLDELPLTEIPNMQMMRVGRMQPSAITHVHHFFLLRPAQALARLWTKAEAVEDDRIRTMLLFFVEQAIWGMSVLARYVPTHYSQVNQYLSGVFYVASQIVDASPWYILEGKLARLGTAFGQRMVVRGAVVVTTEDTGHIGIPDSSVDYIFTDPPFGENIYYSDLNFLIESWHRVLTNAAQEAIVDRVKRKDLSDYQSLMQQCFAEYYRVLKPGRWMTVEFHNSKNSVWNSIQEALQRAGFVVADVRTLDKRQGSFQQVTSAAAVKQDLVISAYKPNGGLEDRFRLEAGTEEGVWDFARTHLKQLPVFVSNDGKAETVAERQNYLLFDRMVAFHVQRGVTVSVSSPEFYAGLEQRFPVRDGMYFLPDQVAEYDRKRMTVTEVLQLDLFVTDESSAIQWLRQQLTKKPQTFQEIHPQFMREIGGWAKHEKALELSDLLEQNFLRYDGKGEVPSQIHSHLSTDFREMRNLTKDDSDLQNKAKDRWYVPDPNKAGDLEKLRERTLLREFEDYRQSLQRKLKVFRLEAVRAGFRKAWQDRDYRTIVDVAGKIPDDVLQEDPKLLMWYDQAVTRMGDSNR